MPHIVIRTASKPEPPRRDHGVIGAVKAFVRSIFARANGAVSRLLLSGLLVLGGLVVLAFFLALLPIGLFLIWRYRRNARRRSATAQTRQSYRATEGDSDIIDADFEVIEDSEVNK